MMPFVFHAPFFLLLLLPLTALAVWRARPAGRFAPSRLQPIGLRCAALALLILALAQPVLPGSAPTAVVFVVDRSESMASRTAVNAWLHGATSVLPSGTQTRQVEFAGDAALLSAGAGYRTAAVGPTSETNIQAGLRLGLGVAPRHAALVLLSDGVQTEGDAASAAALARSYDVTIDPVDPTSIASYPVDAAVTRFDIPSSVHLGDPVPMQITVRSSVARDATLLLLGDGHVMTTQKVSLVAGDNPFSVDLAETVQGWHTYTARAVMSGDVDPVNNQLTAGLFVAGPSRAVVVGGRTASKNVVSLLRQLGFHVQVVSPGGLNATVLGPADEIVLSDLPASALSPAQVRTLEESVRAGLGLVVLGGPHSLSLGKYDHSPLQQLLPVTGAPPGVTRPGELALELVLDRSGSMNNLAGGVPKIEMSQAAADSALSFAYARKDAYGLVSFDMVPHVLVPLQVLSGSRTVARIRRVVARMTADGGTDIYAALQAGFNQLVQSHAPYRHIILMTDGVSEGGPYARLLTKMHQNRITLSTVGMGQDADKGLLKVLAKSGHGRYYYTNNANDLPKIFAREVRRSAGPNRVVGSIPVSIAASSPVVRDLSGMPLPRLAGYPTTTLKTAAIAPLTAGSSRQADPILAQWQIGLGRVLVWAPGLDTSWAGGWMPGRGTGATRNVLAPVQFWDDALRWAQRAVARPLLQPVAVVRDGTPQIEVNTAYTAGRFDDLLKIHAVVASPHNRTSNLSLDEVAPGQYDAALPGGEPGLYRAAVRRDGTSNWTRALLAAPYPAEYALQPPDRTLLASLASLTGGHLLRSSHDLATMESHQAVALWWPLAAGALLLLLISIVFRTLGVSRWG